VAKTKVAVTLDANLVSRIDGLVAMHRFTNRSQAIEAAVAEKLDRLDRSRLARECDKLDPITERRMAEEGMNVDLATWPEY
jgi:metal-responsive CopG/Arc/MetJ family transcriptional regulator